MFDFTGQAARQQAVGWARQVRSVLAKTEPAESLKVIDDAVAQFNQDRVTIAVMGKAKRGKSTLINALLGRSDDLVAPVDVLPASSTISRFFVGDREEATVYFADGHVESIGFDGIRGFVTEEGNPANRLGVTCVDVVGRFSQLDPNVVLVDTPGAASLHAHHDTILHAFIPTADAVIFLVTAEMPIDQSELDLLRQLKAADIRKVFFVINQIDATTQQELRDAISHNSQVLSSVGIQANTIYQISALEAFERRPGYGRVESLVRDLRSFISAGGRTAQLERLQARVTAVAGPALARVQQEIDFARQSEADTAAQLTQLASMRKDLRTQDPRSDQRFLSEWNSAVDVFEERLGQVQRDLQHHFDQVISSTSLVGIKTLEARLPSMMLNELDKRVGPAVQQLEQQLANASEHMRRSLPVFDLRSTSAAATSIRTTKDHEIRNASFKSALWGGVGFSLPVATTAVTAAMTSTATGLAASGVAAGAAVTLNPLTWLPAFFGSAAGAAGAAGATTLTGIATPFLAFIAGPVAGIALAIAVAQVPLAWRRSRLKHKDQLPLAAKEFISDTFFTLRTERVRQIRKAGEALLRDYRRHLDEELDRTEAMLKAIRDNRPSPARLADLDALASDIERAVAALPDASQPTIS